MISTIRNKIEPLIGKKIKFRYNGSRNQIEEFDGVIINCYNYVFVINVGSMNRSFSYSDVLIGVLDVNI
jgi:uncharacterized protein Veg